MHTAKPGYEINKRQGTVTIFAHCVMHALLDFFIRIAYRVPISKTTVPKIRLYFRNKM